MKKRAAIYDEALKYPARITPNQLTQVYKLTETCSAKTHPNKARNANATNCTASYCLQKVGLERWEKFKKTPKSDDSKRYKPRNEDLPCGLYNNANLCYLNSFIQIWFHNIHFKKFVFSYQSVPTFANPVNASGIGIKVQKIMERLQNVFFSLEQSPFEAADAVRLADALMLQDSQQDVSEFHTLFFNFMEKHLEGHPCYPGFKRIHERVNFRTKQVIECPCGRLQEQEQVISGLHLNPDGCNTVADMFEKLFAPNQLTDFNCPQCGERGKSQMRNVPSSLPPVLILQISRVAIDQKKDRTPIHYPREINESQLLADARGHHKFNLAAVCVHDGAGATSGHYHDYVYDYRRKAWFNFNDAVVKSVKPPGVDAGMDLTKTTADMRGCYLLVYRRDTDLTAERDPIVLPPRAEVILKRILNDAESLRHSTERSEKLWYKKAQEAHQRLEKMMSELRVPSADLVKKKPADIVFIPASLIFNIVEKNYRAIETCVNLNALEEAEAEDRKQKRKELRATEQLALQAANSSDSSNGAPSGSPSKATMTRLQNKYGDIDNLTPAMIADIEKTMNAAASPPSKQARTTNGRCRRTSARAAAAAAASASAAESSSTSQPFVADSSDESDVEDRVSDDTKYSLLYLPEVPDYHEMPVCPHGKVPLIKVLLGEMKAVRRAGADKMLKDHGLDLTKKVITYQEGTGSVEMNAGQWLTANDLCSECTEALREEAEYSKQIDEVEPMITAILKDASRAVTKKSAPQRSMLLVSRKELTAHRRLALQQHEYKRKSKEFVANSLCFTRHVPAAPVVARGRKRKHTNESEQTPVLPLPPAPVPVEKAYEVKHDPASPLKIKLCLSKPANTTQKPEPAATEPSSSSSAYVNGNNFNIDDDKPCSSKDLLPRNGRVAPVTPQKRIAPVAAESVSDHMPTSEEEEESDSESDPDWNGRESPKNGKRKYRAVGSPKKRKGKRTPKKKTHAKTKNTTNGDAHETAEAEAESAPPSHPVIFNADIACNHSKVRLGAKMIRITEAEWEKIVVPFFDEFYKFSADCTECAECEEQRIREAELNAYYRSVISAINTDLAPLLRALDKRKFTPEDLGDKYDRVICGRFVEAFRAAAKSRSASVAVPPLCQGCLICEKHNQPFVVMSPNGPIVGNAIPVTADEWEAISSSYKTHYPEHSDNIVDIELDEDGAVLNHCQPCYIQYCSDEDKKRFQYTEGYVYVKVKDFDEDYADGTRSTRALTTRRAAARNCFKLVLSSSTPIFDVKLEMCRRMGFSPNDQLFIYMDRVLENSKTLADCRVEANNEDEPIILIAQTQAIDNNDREIDRGFQDTALGF
uniref:ubiquitinyl hydrolase 1 n=1 Tax=Panagrellus redivivus TaxID=6233 RepID=A0A7E4W471_PANRE